MADSSIGKKTGVIPPSNSEPFDDRPYKKTLYVTDLDGTLLRRDQKTSAFTNCVINELVEKGVLFSYATARSYSTAHKVTEGMTAAFPVIVYNGAFIRDNQSGQLLRKNFFSNEEGVSLAHDLMSGGVNPIVYKFVRREEKFSYLQQQVNRATMEFIQTRESDSRNHPVSRVEELIEGELFYFTCIDDAKVLQPFYEKYKEQYHCVYQSDIYTHDQWLEIMPKNASKALAIRQLAELLDCGKIIVFGDGPNDEDMFRIADEAYAVENAAPELKKIATGVIGSNDDDGVARWLLENTKPS